MADPCDGLITRPRLESPEAIAFKDRIYAWIVEQDREVGVEEVAAFRQFPDSSPMLFAFALCDLVDDGLLTRVYQAVDQNGVVRGASEDFESLCAKWGHLWPRTIYRVNKK